MVRAFASTLRVYDGQTAVMRVLLTGAEGTIGTAVREHLGDRFELVSLTLTPQRFPSHVADISDLGAIQPAFEGVEAVVHLAASPAIETPWDEVLRNNLVGSYNVFEAARRAGVSRVVFASSNHAVGRTPRSDLLEVGVPPRADTFYGTAKVAAEALLQLYADRHGLDAIACRIGSFTERPENARALSTWLSPDDCVRMVDAALTAPAPGFAVLYGISANTRGWWDLEPGRRLGYEPADDAEEFAADVPASEQDHADAAYVGGPYALDAFYRPAVDRQS